MDIRLNFSDEGKSVKRSIPRQTYVEPQIEFVSKSVEMNGTITITREVEMMRDARVSGCVKCHLMPEKEQECTRLCRR